MKVIELTQGRVTIVDDEDFEWLAQWRWNYYKERTHGGYAHRTTSGAGGIKRHHLLMHREIMSPIPDGMEIDHINGDKLDNRRCNLRFATRQQNRHNCSRYSNSTTGIKGVALRKKKTRPFQAHICVEGKKIHLGYFPTIESASEAYNHAAIRLHGSFARLN